MTCALCEEKIGLHCIKEEKQIFCCSGCLTVHRILSAKNQLENVRNNPVFLQALQSGIISNPVLEEQLKMKTIPHDRDVEKFHFEVGEMWCPACAEVIRLILLQEKGVHRCFIDYATDIGVVEFIPQSISKEKISLEIRSLGYSCNPFGVQTTLSKILYLRCAVAAFCSANIMMLAYPIYSSFFHGDPQEYNAVLAWCSFFLSLPVLIFSSWPILRRFWIGLKTGLFGMESLVSIGIGSAFILSTYELLQNSYHIYYDSMSVVVALVLLGKIFEEKAKFSAKDSIFRLSKAYPKKGRKQFPDGSLHFVPIKEIVPGDILAAFTGEKLILDGVVIDGIGTCDESIVTGEVVPVLKECGQKVLGGSILISGTIFYRATCKMESSFFHQILDLAQQEVGNKCSYVRAADSVVRWFVPVVLGFALMVGIYSHSFLRALSVLLISCPCAIGIAAPLVESYVLNSFSSLGALVRNRAILKLLGEVTVFVFDKTGTVTEGKFIVQKGLENLSKEELIFLKSITSQTTHPIAKAIFSAIQQPTISLNGMEEIAGEGIEANHKNLKLLLGSEKFLKKNNIPIPNIVAKGFSSCVFFSTSAECVYPIFLGDQIRNDAKETMKTLSRHAKTILLSGDGKSAVEYVAQECNFHSYQFSRSPMEKKECVANLRKEGHIICMIGDGINDSPALASAHVGISVVSATDISIQVSDLLLTSERLQIIPKLFSLSRRSQTIVKQNLFWAFFYNCIGIGLAAFGVLSPIFSAFAMMASSTMVLLNSRRASLKN